MTKDEYYKEIVDILDNAARDTDALTMQNYADLCGQVADDAQGRCDAAEADIARELDEAE